MYMACCYECENFTPMEEFDWWGTCKVYRPNGRWSAIGSATNCPYRKPRKGITDEREEAGTDHNSGIQ